MSSVASWIVRLGAWGVRFVNSLLENTITGKICVSLLQIGGSESD